MLPESFWVYKENCHLQENFACKEKSGTVKKARKLRSIISFILEICYKHHVVNVEITHKIRTFFKTLASKNVAKSRLKKSQRNNKLSRKPMFFSYHREWKTFIEASCTNNIRTGENAVCSCHFSMFVNRFFSDKVRKRVAYFGLFESFLHF